ncbi:MAG: hypothetical protein ACJ761_06010 [Chloroflexota bacterium]
MTDQLPRPMTEDDQPTDDRTDMPAHERDDPSRTSDPLVGGDSAALRTDPERQDEIDDEPLFPAAVDLEDHERFDTDDRAKPGIDDYTD